MPRYGVLRLRCPTDIQDPANPEDHCAINLRLPLKDDGSKQFKPLVLSTCLCGQALVRLPESIRDPWIRSIVPQPTKEVRDSRHEQFCQDLGHALRVHGIEIYYAALTIVPDQIPMWEITISSASTSTYPTRIRFASGTDPYSQVTLDQLVTRLIVKLSLKKDDEGRR